MSKGSSRDRMSAFPVIHSPPATELSFLNFLITFGQRAGLSEQNNKIKYRLVYSGIDVETGIGNEESDGSATRMVVKDIR